jgi:hypothetical protein
LDVLAKLSQTAVLGAVRVTAEQFGDTPWGSCPETTLFSVTDKPHTDYDIRQLADSSAP